ADGLTTLHLCSQVEADFENSGLRGEQVVLAVQRLRENCRRLAKPGARLLSSFDCAQVYQNVAQTTLRDAMHIGGGGSATAHFRGNDYFTLVLRFNGQQARAGDVRIEE